MSYFSYHGHTHFSNLRLIDSTNTTEGVLNRAHELGLKGVAITDHETLSSFIRAEKYLASKQGKGDPVWDELRFVRGSEIYLTRDGLNAETFIPGVDRFFHFVLLAKDIEGYKQLNKLSSRAWHRSYRHYQIRVPTYYQDLREIVGSNPGHLIGSTACLGSALSTKLLQAKDGIISIDEALQWGREWLESLSEIFGKENLFVELQPGITDEQIYANKYLYQLAKEEGYLPTITTDYHYLRKEDRDTHRAFLKTKQGDREVDAFYEATYMMTTEDIHSRMDEHLGADVVQECLDNTLKVLDMIEDFSLLKPLELPYLPKEQFDLPLVDAQSADVVEVVNAVPLLQNYLDDEDLANKQFATRIIRFLQKESEISGKKNYEIKEKADYMNDELKLIWDSGQKQNVNWSRYFLQSSDYINLWWDITLVAPGRGSAGASYVSYALEITQVDPTREKAPLLVERFMNPDRASVLDIDSDVSSNKRDQCITLMEETYGSENVVRVATFRTETAKSAIQTAARAVGMDVDDARFISGTIPAERGIVRTLAQTYYGDEEQGMKPVREFVRQMNLNPRLWEIAQSIEGLITGLGAHAGGVIVTEKPITEYCGVMKTNRGFLVTAYDLHELEEMSLIKIDLLATQGLQKIQTALELLVEYGYAERKSNLRETYEEVLGIYNINRDNPGMWDMANNGEIISLFQMEQQSGVEGMRIVKPRTVEALATLNSTIRLTSQSGGESPVGKFQRFSMDHEEWEKEMEEAGITEHQKEILRDMLGHSHGMAVHQEDLYQFITHPEIAGMTFGEADQLRKAVAKKTGNDFDIFEEKYYENAHKKGLDINFVNYVWKKLILPQRGYSFRY